MEEENNNNENDIVETLKNKEIFDEVVELKEHLEANTTDSRDEEIKQLKDQMLRLAAEIENFKKRSQKEMDDLKNYSITNFAKDLIIVMDNLHRSIESLQTAEDETPRVRAVIEGIEVIKKELGNVFTRYHIHSVNPQKGDNFDHNLHQVISQIPTDEVEKGKIYNVLQIGYSIKERLLRPALVGVAKSPNKDE